jgi:metal-responsive CopG/Arc/MetJ family transcriptional regulator
MRSVKIAITIEEDLLKSLDDLVDENQFPNRSKAVQEAIREKLQRIKRNRLASECAKLDPAYEKAMAEEGLSEDADQWPAY